LTAVKWAEESALSWIRVCGDGRRQIADDLAAGERDPTRA
jgi:hypothetical protein